MAIRKLLAASALLAPMFVAVGGLTSPAQAAITCFTGESKVPPATYYNQGTAACRKIYSDEKLRVTVDCSGYTPLQYGPWVYKSAQSSKKTCPGGTYVEYVSYQIRPR